MSHAAKSEAPAAAPSRPLRNRVTPWGEIVAIAQRGLFTGNRGIIHDPATKTLVRRWAGKAWLICECRYKDRWREVMAQRSWTELFFHDEAVALAAGHRPCFLCRRARADAFRAAWAKGCGASPPTAPALDGILHRERLLHGRKRLHASPCPPEDLPAGTMVQVQGAACTLAGGWAWRWTEEGYTAPMRPSRCEAVLTPPSTLRALRAGYVPVLHPSIAAS